MIWIKPIPIYYPSHFVADTITKIFDSKYWQPIPDTDIIILPIPYISPNISLRKYLADTDECYPETNPSPNSI